MLKVLIYVEFYEVNPQNMQSQSVRILYLERTGEGKKTNVKSFTSAALHFGI